MFICLFACLCSGLLQNEQILNNFTWVGWLGSEQRKTWRNFEKGPVHILGHKKSRSFKHPICKSRSNDLIFLELFYVWRTWPKEDIILFLERYISYYGYQKIPNFQKWLLVPGGDYKPLASWSGMLAFCLCKNHYTCLKNSPQKFTLSFHFHYKIHFLFIHLRLLVLTEPFQIYFMTIL